MAITNGNDYDHIDITDGQDTTRHMLKDAAARLSLIQTAQQIQNVQSDCETQINAVQSLATGLVGNLSSLMTIDKTSVVNAINEVKNGSVSSDQITNVRNECVGLISAAQSSINTTIGDLNNLSTENKSNVVSAINEISSGSGTSDLISVQNSRPSSDSNKLWIVPNDGTEIEVPTLDDFNETIGSLSNLTTTNKTNIVSAINEVDAKFIGSVDEAVSDWLDQHPDITTTVEDGSISKQKLNSSLQQTVDNVDTLTATTGTLRSEMTGVQTSLGTLQTSTSNLISTVNNLNGGRYNKITSRWHVDCVNGNDNDTGAAGHAWRTLDKFFSMANLLSGGRADIRCYLDTPGTYDVGTSSDQILTFTGIAIHITGSVASDPEYDGNYIVRFLGQNPPKFYVCHVNFKNLKIQCPNTTDFALDGGNASITNCYIDTRLSIYTTPTHINGGIVRNVLISGSNVNATNVVTTLTTGNQWELIKNSSLLYGGSIGNANLLANSTYPSFSVSASTLMPLQVYPTTLGPSITANNSFIIGTSARLTTWQTKAGSLANTIWITG